MSLRTAAASGPTAFVRAVWRLMGSVLYLPIMAFDALALGGNPDVAHSAAALLNDAPTASASQQ